MVAKIKLFYSYMHDYQLSLGVTIAVSLITNAIVGSIFFWIGNDPSHLAGDVPTKSTALFLSLLMILLIFMIALRLRTLQDIITDYLQGVVGNIEYRKRLAHFKDEKEVLCKALVTEHLPKIVSDLVKDRQIGGIDVIIDSGTTLCSVFASLKLYGIPTAKDVDIQIYTNSLSGVDAFMAESRFIAYPIGDEQIHLLGGSPLRKYRAVTGIETENALMVFRNDQTDDQERERRKNRIVIGMLSGNWFPSGIDMNNLTISANGRRHPEFKQGIVDVSDVVIIVSPLGKVLKVENTRALNGIFSHIRTKPEDQYHEVKWGVKKCFLLTSRRKPGSFLATHSDRLEEKKKTRNYFLLNSEYYSPSGDSGRQKEYEMPHDYTLGHDSEMFHLSIK